MTNVFKKVCTAICSYPRAVVIVCVAIAILLGSQATRLNIDLSLSKRFVGDDETSRTYKGYLETFGPEASLIVAVESRNGSMWDRGNFERLRKLTDELSRITGIQEVVSVASIPGFDVPVDSLKKLPIVRKLMVNNDGTVTAVLIRPASGMLGPTLGMELVRRVRGVVDRFTDPSWTLRVAGPLVLQTAAIEYSRRDIAIITIIALVAILIILGFAFRSVVASAAPIAVAAITVAMTLGILALSGFVLSQFALIAVPVLVGLGVLDGVHIVHAHLSEPDPLAKEIAPCFWTSLTTLVGFGVLITSPIEQIRSIGLVMAIGIPISFLLSFTLLPSLLSFQRGRPLKQDRLAEVMAQFVERRRTWVVIISLVIFLVAGVGMLRLNVSLDFPHIFRSGLAVQRDQNFVDDRLGGAASFEIVLKSAEPGGFRDPEIIKRVASLSQALRLSANVATTVSYLDIGVSALIADGADLRKLRLDSETVESVLDRLEGEPRGKALLRRWIADDFSTARVHVKLNTARPDLHERLSKSLDYLAGSFSKWFDVRPTGFAYLYKSMEGVMLDSFLSTFLYALIGVMIILFYIARKIRLGLAAALANLLPIAVILGIMGWCGVGISVGMVILPAVGLGLVVDDTIHFIMAMRRSGGKGREAIASVYRSTGWPIAMTQLILLATFGSLIASYFVSNIMLGIFMSLLLVGGLAFDLLFVPALILIWERSSHSN